VWEIYSIGDAAFLESILNAVAMLAGTADLKQLAGVGFLLGVLLVLFQGILGGAYSIKFQNVLIAWVIYALMCRSARPRSARCCPTSATA
jgi:conjugal transfer mating pair stabilization protein TraG